MASVTTGLVSGFDYGSFIDQLMAVEARPKNQLERRNAVLTTQQTALQTVNAKLLSIKLDAAALSRESTFKATTATSSNETALTASSGSSAVPGSYNFQVAQLVAAQQMLSDGMADADTTAVGQSSLRFEPDQARLKTQTQLGQLNGGEGVARGSIRITDRSGASATIDLSKALSVDDVIDQINLADGISVQARVGSHGLVIDDLTGLTDATLQVRNTGNTTTAHDLGLTVAASGNRLMGLDINTISKDTLLSDLNDGLGIRSIYGVNDFQIVARDGTSHQIDLTDDVTLEDVFETIAQATGGKVTADMGDDQRSIRLIDTTGGPGTMVVQALNDSMAALDMEITGSDDDADGDIEGSQLIASINSKMLKNLNGGTGIGASRSSVSYAQVTGSTAINNFFNGVGLNTNGNSSLDVVIHSRDSTYFYLDLDGLNTVDDLINRIDTESGGKVSANIVDNKLVLTDNVTGGGSFRVWQHPNNTAGTQLGWEQDVGQGDTISGVDLQVQAVAIPPGGPGSLRFTTADGTQTDVDLNHAASVSDVLSLINESGASVEARLNTAGNGIEISDLTSGPGTFSIADIEKFPGTNLNITGTFNDGHVDSGNLQLAYLGENTTLEELDIVRGKFVMTDSLGAQATVDLTQGNEKTIKDVIDEINSRGIAVEARINDTGDGLLIEDTGGGSLAIMIEEDGSTTARSLGILQTAELPGEAINGSFERTVEIDSDDTLEDMRDKINDAELGITASIINDGSSSGYRLSLVADEAGSRGAFIFDDGDLDMNMMQIAEAKDAVMFYGSGEDSVMIQSKSNTIDDVIPGVTLTLKNVTQSPVNITVSRNTSSVTDAINRFVTSFNDVIKTIDDYDSYDAETNQRGVLLGDSGVLQVRSALYNAVIGSDKDLEGRYTNLAQIGLTIGSGAKLNFDSSKFTEAYNTDPQAVIDMFTFKATDKDDEGQEVITAAGFGVDINELLERLTDIEYGAIESRISSIDSQMQLNRDRMDQYDIQLEAKRLRLETQFIAMERAMADMQSQSQAINSLSALVPSSTGA